MVRQLHICQGAATRIARHFVFNGDDMKSISMLLAFLVFATMGFAQQRSDQACQDVEAGSSQCPLVAWSWMQQPQAIAPGRAAQGATTSTAAQTTAPSSSAPGTATPSTPQTVAPQPQTATPPGTPAPNSGTPSSPNATTPNPNPNAAPGSMP